MVAEVLGRIDPLAEVNDGVLTTASTLDGTDMYDFGSRAIVAREIKDDLELGPLEPLPSPRTVEFEPTLLCNANCHFCSYEDDIAAFKEERRMLPIAERSLGLSRDVVMSVLDSLKEGGTTTGVFWSGGGDPLMWPHIVEAVRYAATFAENSVQTNGIGLAKFFRDPSEALGAIRLLTVSVYADTPELHAEVAGVNSFNKVVQNLRRAKEIRDAEGLEDLTIAAKILVSQKNYRRVPEIVRFYREMGLDSVGLREVQNFKHSGDERTDPVALTPDQKRELSDIITSSGYKDPSLDSFGRVTIQRLAVPTVTDHCFNATDGHFACIDALGNVFLGNPEIGDERFSIGNIVKQSWSGIWKSERHLKVVEDMDAMQAAGICASAMCRHVRANVGVQRYVSGEAGRQDRQAVMRALGAFL